MTMRELTYQVSFNTPAFLGNAEQQGQWRTPPFKALLRQWWRVVKAPQVGYDHHRLLQAENDLFGAASDDGHGGSHRSRVQLRLSGWASGTISSDKDAIKLDWLKHDEVDPRKFDPHKGEKVVRADVYMGYGPIGRSSAISPGSNSPVTLKLRCPIGHADDLHNAMQLAHWFGTLGSRSRNGWGSLHIAGEGLLSYGDLTETNLLTIACASPLQQALSRDWAHGFCLTEQNRVAAWLVANIDIKAKTLTGFSSWRDAMVEMARIKIAYRTALKFPVARATQETLQDRHVLGFPVTHHGVRNISNDKRLTSSLRLKVHCNNGKFFALITHLPCGIPREFMANPPDIAFQERVWSRIYEILNTQFKDRVTPIKKGA